MKACGFLIGTSEAQGCRTLEASRLQALGLKLYISDKPQVYMIITLIISFDKLKCHNLITQSKSHKLDYVIHDKEQNSASQ